MPDSSASDVGKAGETTMRPATESTKAIWYAKENAKQNNAGRSSDQCVAMRKHAGLFRASYSTARCVAVLVARR